MSESTVLQLLGMSLHGLFVVKSKRCKCLVANTRSHLMYKPSGAIMFHRTVPELNMA